MIKKDMKIGDVLDKYPNKAMELAMVMTKYGLHCVGCHVAAYETIEQGCLGHGMKKKDVDKLVDALNKVIKKK